MATATSGVLDLDDWERDVAKMMVGWTVGMLAGIAVLVWVMPHVAG